MNEVENHLELIFKSYNISFKNLNERKTEKLLFEASSPLRLRNYLKEQFHKEINMEEAKDLEILLLTYQYIAHN